MKLIAIVSTAAALLIVCGVIVFIAWAKLAANTRKMYRPTKVRR